MSNTKTNSEMLTAIKQSNKLAREERAKRLGFKTSKDLILYLEDAISKGKGNSPFVAAVAAIPTVAPIKTKTKTKVEPTLKRRATVITNVPTIHVVDILDASGSMFGRKFDAALKGINIGIKQLKEDKAAVKYTYTLCDFSDDIIFHHLKTHLDSVSTIKGSTRGSTALFDAIGKSVTNTAIGLKDGDKVLVNIYTDGQENSSREFKSHQISDFITNLTPKGWTFTFIGTDVDVKYAQSILKFHSSNTLVYDGTADGLEKSFVSNSVARTAYSSKVEKGEDVSTGFYKDIK